jgi:hypothetical protein
LAERYSNRISVYFQYLVHLLNRIKMWCPLQKNYCLKKEMGEDRSRRRCEKLRWITKTIMLLKFNFISQYCLSVYVSYYLQILFKVSLKTKNHKNRPQVKSDSNHTTKIQFWTYNQSWWLKVHVCWRRLLLPYHTY